MYETKERIATCVFNKLNEQRETKFASFVGDFIVFCYCVDAILGTPFQGRHFREGV